MRATLAILGGPVQVTLTRVAESSEGTWLGYWRVGDRYLQVRRNRYLEGDDLWHLTGNGHDALRTRLPEKQFPTARVRQAVRDQIRRYAGTQNEPVQAGVLDHQNRAAGFGYGWDDAITWNWWDGDQGGTLIEVQVVPWMRDQARAIGATITHEFSRPDHVGEEE